jgi:acyl dehydratase
MPGEMFLDEIEVGAAWEGGYKFVDRREILRFASRYDPQPFHLDDEAGRMSAFGGLIASGWHTLAMMMRMLVDAERGRMPGRGLIACENVHWLQPVRPGDRLRLRRACIEKSEATGGGTATMRVTVLNQRAVAVMTLDAVFGYRSRRK